MKPKTKTANTPKRKRAASSDSLERMVSLSGVVVERRTTTPRGFELPTDEVDIRVFDTKMSATSTITLSNFALRAERLDKIKLSIVVKKKVCDESPSQTSLTNTSRAGSRSQD